jgi:hypothetical protein
LFSLAEIALTKNDLGGFDHLSDIGPTRFGRALSRLDLVSGLLTRTGALSQFQRKLILLSFKELFDAFHAHPYGNRNRGGELIYDDFQHRSDEFGQRDSGGGNQLDTCRARPG